MKGNRNTDLTIYQVILVLLIVAMWCMVTFVISIKRIPNEGLWLIIFLTAMAGAAFLVIQSFKSANK